MPNKEELAKLMGHDAYAELTGLEVIKAIPGEVEVRLPVTSKILNGHGNVHGGALYTLADYAGAAASNLYGFPTIAVNGSISYLRAIQSGHIVAKAKTVRHGKRMNFQMVELYNADGELAATFQGASLRVSRGPEGASNNEKPA